VIRGARLTAACVLCGLITAAPGTDPGAAGARYWTAAELDTRPQIKTHVMPEYPRDLPSGVRGRVVLELRVSAAGEVERVSVVKAQPPGRFEQSAVRAFSAARFTPGLRKGTPVPSLLRFEVTFGG
jgi:periplasmic protein TonB